MNTVTLPWPPKELSPNARVHWTKHSIKAGEYRTACWALAKEAKFVLGSNPHLSITFCPPDNRRRDLDNMLASIKAGLDGLSQAVGVDDSEFRLTIAKGGKVPSGAVIVEGVE